MEDKGESEMVILNTGVGFPLLEWENRKAEGKTAWKNLVDNLLCDEGTR